MINRPVYLNQLTAFKDTELIKVITGIRRCGKSSLLALYSEYLRAQNIKEENIIQINFEDLKYDNLTYKDLNDIAVEKLNKTEDKVYLLFDEIQKIEKWELAINSIRLNKKADIYITGSNAYLLSSQLATYLSGRYIEIKMQPLSFGEFLDFYKFDTNISKEEKFNAYLKFGGMPGLTIFNFNEQMINQTLEGIFATVITKDIIDMAKIKDTALLKKIIKFLADNIGNNVSLNKIKNTLISQNNISKSMRPEIIDNYILALENAFIFYGVNRYDIKGKEYLKTQGKYYIVDLGLRNHLLGFKNRDRGHILENVVYMELLKRGYNVSIGKIQDKEVDFIATKADKKIYIQVTESIMQENTRDRELQPLKRINDNYEKILLTTDNLFTNTDDEGIKIINLIDWLLKI